MTKYAAYDDVSIYAIGRTPEEAVQKAREDAKDPSAKFKTSKVDDKMARDIEENGWNGNSDSFDLVNGYLVRSEGLHEAGMRALLEHSRFPKKRVVREGSDDSKRAQLVKDITAVVRGISEIPDREWYRSGQDPKGLVKALVKMREFMSGQVSTKKQTRVFAKASDVAAVDEMTEDAYSRNKYDNWRDVIATVLSFGFSTKAAAWFLNSKHARWAADAASSDTPTAEDVVVYIGRSGGLAKLKGEAEREAAKED